MTALPPYPQRPAARGRLGAGSWRALGAGLASLAVLTLLPTAGTAARDVKPRITGLRVNANEAGQIMVGFRIQGAFDERLRERIDSGLPGGFSFEIQLLRERFWWFDAHTDRRLERTASYDAVAMEYRVHTRLDGDLVATRVVPKHGDLLEALTVVEPLPVFPSADQPRGKKVQVRVRAKLGSSHILGFIPNSITTAWAESLKFRPRL